MSERVLVDANILLRHLLGDNALHSPAATRFIAEIAVGSYVAIMSDTVVFETIYVLEKQRGLSRSEIHRQLGEIITTPNVELPDKGMSAEVFRRYVERPALSFADCCHIVLARKLSGGRLATFDKAVGKSEGVDWIEPT